MIDLNAVFDELFPITRSITGAGYRSSIAVFARHMDIDVHRYETGKQVFDWTVPKEWEISEANLTTLDGQKICDMRDHNLHVVNYSTPIDQVFTLAELQPHLYSYPALPGLIPYVTSYYKDSWGFCIPHEQREVLPDTKYRAVIKSRHYDGSVEVAEANIKGETDDLVLLSSYLCHPQMANNELSGPLVLLRLHELLSQQPKLRFSYRFVINPETIGSVCYLSSHGEELKARLRAGIVLTCLGGQANRLTYKLSRKGCSSVDRLMKHMAARDAITMRPFSPVSGSDERQYCSPGFNLPMGQMARTAYLSYPEYHSSGDTKEFMGIGTVEESAQQIFDMLMIHERIAPLSRYEPHCEIQLGKRGLYPNINSGNRDRSSDDYADSMEQFMGMGWMLNLADGEHDIVDVAEQSGIPIKNVIRILDKLIEQNIVYMSS